MTMIEGDAEQRLHFAAIEYHRRRGRRGWPPGQFDGVGRWVSHEVLACCIGRPPPTRGQPYRAHRHAVSIEHVATLYGVDPEALRARVIRPRVAVVAGEAGDE